MLLGRALELEELNRYYDREGSQTVIVYGEKNTGKTALINEFVKDKSFYYYKARSASEREQRYQWGKELDQDMDHHFSYPTYTEIFQAVPCEHTVKKVIIIDEFQYIVKASNVFMRELAEYMHSSLKNSDVLIILCSSSIAWVENSMIPKIKTEDYEVSGCLSIKELAFEYMADYFPGFKIGKILEAYAVLGGFPGLWICFDDKLSVKENICKNVLDKTGVLHEEGPRIVEAELRETGIYNTILASIAAGNHKLNDLYLHTGFSRAKISVYLKNLIELHLVTKITSYDTEGKENVKKGFYSIKNNIVNFYFTFIYPHLSRFENMHAQDFYNDFVGPYFRTYVSDYFKRICVQCMKQWNKSGRLPIKAVDFEEWTGKSVSIDFLLRGENGESIIGLCNFEKTVMCYEDYKKLFLDAEKAGIHVDYVYLFSASRFDEKLNLEAKIKRNLKLITMEEM